MPIDKILHKVRGFVVSADSGEPLSGIEVSLVATGPSLGITQDTTHPTNPAVCHNYGSSDAPTSMISKMRSAATGGDGRQVESASAESSRMILNAIRAEALGENHQPAQTTEPTQTIKKLQLATLYSDRAGYFSFDVSKIEKNPTFSALFPVCTSAWKQREDILEIDRPLDFLSVHSLDPGVFELRVKPDTPRAHGMALKSIENPDTLDWQISPQSFVNSPAMLVGDDGTTLLPSSYATHDYYFHELGNIGGWSVSGEGKRSDPSNFDISALSKSAQVTMTGTVYEYKQEWYPLGHALGDIVYSLALAPGEAVNLAVLDWSRVDNASRLEGIEYDESLQHNQAHDRTIDEIVNAALDETQGGESSIWGVGGAIGAPIGAGAAIGITGGYSSGSSSSYGHRTLSGTTTQNIADTVSQISNMQRRLRSTVIVQATQKEATSAQTRTIINRNLRHALTVEYYEVLRHMKVVTKCVGTRDVLLVPFTIIAFDDARALRFRHILQKVLLDPSLEPCFDSLAKWHYQSGQLPGPAPTQPVLQPWEGDSIINCLKIAFEVSGAASDWPKTNGVASHAGQWFHWSVKLEDCVTHEDRGTRIGTCAGNVILNEGHTNTVTVQCDSFKRSDVKSFSIWAEANSWTLGPVTVDWQADDGTTGALVRSADSKNMNWGITKEMSPEPLPDKPAPAPPPQVDEVQAKLEAQLKQWHVEEQMLLDHLNSNAVYYSRAIWFLQDPNERVLMLRNWQYNNKPLLQYIENTPLAVKGNLVAFPLQDSVSRDVDPDEQVRLVSIPTRGVFAETMLSHNEGLEQRDITRYWQWMESYIPSAPGIEPVSTGSRNAPLDTIPSALPAPVVQIANTPAVPDPTGLSAAFNLLGQPNIFRDMSGMSQVAGLLNGLTSGAMSLAQARQAAQNIKSNTNQQGAEQSGVTIPHKQKPLERLANAQVAQEVGKIGQSLGLNDATTHGIETETMSDTSGIATASPAGVLEVAATMPHATPPESLSSAGTITATTEPIFWHERHPDSTDWFVTNLDVNRNNIVMPDGAIEQCLHASKFMANHFGMFPGAPSENESYQIGKIDDGHGTLTDIDPKQAEDGLTYLSTALGQQFPVVVGVDWDVPPVGNRNPTTKHFVLICRKEDDGSYLFRDPGTRYNGDRSWGKFTVQPGPLPGSKILVKGGKTNRGPTDSCLDCQYQVTEIRINNLT